MLWIARNKDGKVYLYNGKPKLNEESGIWDKSGILDKLYLGKDKEINISWKDSPVLVRIAVPENILK